MTEVIGLYQPKSLVEWRGRLGNREADRQMQEAADLGTKVHALIEEAFSRGEAVEAEGDDLAHRLAAQVWTWAVSEGVKVVSQEEGLLNAQDGYGGTPDLICTMNGLPALVVADWKTSSSIKDTYRLQLAAYARAYNLKHGLTWADGVNQGVIVRPKKREPDKPPQVKMFKQLERDWPAFEGLLTFWKFLEGRGPWATT